LKCAEGGASNDDCREPRGLSLLFW
jgi:hypothetical protein